MTLAQEIVVGIADIKIGAEPAIIKTNLGSCIAVCLYAEQKKIGGMLHLMMASSEGAQGRIAGELKKAKYADTSIPELVAQLERFSGLPRSEFRAKIFGGAKVLKVVSQNIGADNEVAVRKILSGLGIRIIAAKTGGENGYRIEFNLSTGRVLCQVFGKTVEEY